MNYFIETSSYKIPGRLDLRSLEHLDISSDVEFAM